MKERRERDPEVGRDLSNLIMFTMAKFKSLERKLKGEKFENRKCLPFPENNRSNKGSNTAAA